MTSNIAARVVNILYTMYPDYDQISDGIDSLQYTFSKLDPKDSEKSVKALGKSLCAKLGIISAIISATIAEDCDCIYKTLTPTIPAKEDTQSSDAGDTKTGNTNHNKSHTVPKSAQTIGLHHKSLKETSSNFSKKYAAF